jgi:hypothetical protein
VGDVLGELKSAGAGAASSAASIAMDLSGDDLDGPLLLSQLHALSQESGSSRALSALASNELLQFSPAPDKPHSPRSAGAGVRFARKQLEDLIRSRGVKCASGRRTAAEIAAAAAAGAPAAKFGSARYRAELFETSKSAVQRIDVRPSRTLLTPETRGGQNRAVSSRCMALLSFWMDEKADRDELVDIGDIEAARRLFEWTLSRCDLGHSVDGISDDDTDLEDEGESGAGAVDDEEVDLTMSAQSAEGAAAAEALLSHHARSASASLHQPQQSLNSHAQMLAAQRRKAQRRRARARMAAWRKQQANRPLSQASLSRLCSALGWSQQTAQPRKATRRRPTFEAEIEHYQQNVKLWPDANKFVMDEWQLRHSLGPDKTYRKRNSGGAYIAGEHRGSSTTVVSAVCGGDNILQPGFVLFASLRFERSL